MKTPVKVVFAAFAVGLLAMPAWAQDSSPATREDAITGYESAAHQSFQGIATDWSSHHVVYSKPEPGSDAENTVQQDPRYWMQQIRRSREASDPSLADAAVAAEADTATQSDSKKKKHKKKKNTLSGLWSVNLGSGATVGNEMYPATFTASPTVASCTNDFIVYNTSIASPSIVGFDNIYGGSPTPFCSGTVPQVNWAFSTGGTVVTSPVVSVNGQQVAFVQTVGTTANLVVLTWKAGSGTIASPTALSSSAGYPSCTAPCMISLPFSGTPNDTNSSPFVISFGAAQGTLYVGDNAGKLHKFTNVFTSGTPVEDTTSPWPITVHASTVLSSPVADANTNNIFVGDAGGTVSYVRDTGSATGTCASGSPPCLGGTTIAQGGKIVDGPLLDVSTQRVTWFNGTIAASGTTDRVQQTNETLTSEGIVNFANNGATGQTSNMHEGAFDNAYFTSPSTGFLYVIARNATHYDHASLFRIGFTGNNMNSVAASGPLDMVGGSTALTFARTGTAITLSGATIPANATGTATVTTDPGNGNTLTVGTVVYTFHSSSGFCADSATTGCIIHGGTTTQDAQNIEAAINDNAAQCGFLNGGICFLVTAANPGASATNPATAVTTITNELGGGAESSPVTEIQTSTTDDFFASVQANGSRTGCAGACLYSFAISSQTFPANSTAGLAATGGTSGLSIDNIFSTAGASQVYFTPLANQSCTTGGTGGCAFQASQALLN